MINFDKYREEIASEIKTRSKFANPIPCAVRAVHKKFACVGTDCKDCSYRSLTWLLQKYEQPLWEQARLPEGNEE